MKRSGAAPLPSPFTSRATDEGVGTPAGADVLALTATVAPVPEGAGMAMVVVMPPVAGSCAFAPPVPTATEVAAGSGVALARIGGGLSTLVLPPPQAESPTTKASAASANERFLRMCQSSGPPGR